MAVYGDIQSRRWRRLRESGLIGSPHRRPRHARDSRDPRDTWNVEVDSSAQGPAAAGAVAGPHWARRGLAADGTSPIPRDLAATWRRRAAGDLRFAGGGGGGGGHRARRVHGEVRRADRGRAYRGAHLGPVQIGWVFHAPDYMVLPGPHEQFEMILVPMVEDPTGGAPVSLFVQLARQGRDLQEMFDAGELDEFHHVTLKQRRSDEQPVPESEV